MNDFFQAGLVDWNPSGLESFYFALVVVYANDIVADVGKTGSCDKPDIAGTDD
jgi:hypothetical protein